MAESAGKGGVAAQIRPPDYRAAVSKIRSIKAKKEKIGSVNGEIADIWAKVEGHKVNKVAGKFFAKLDALEPADRIDILRSFNGLADVADWPKDSADIVDMAEGTRVKGRLAGEEPGGEGDDDGAGGGDDDAEEQQEEEGKPRGFKAAMERSRGHLGGKDAGKPKAANG